MPKKTTASTKRHAFVGFRERVDAIKIDPTRKLAKRAHDFVETSHFAASLDYWKELNITGEFGLFVRQVEPISASLAQIILHQQEIFDKLSEFIVKRDLNFLQPLLELLSQFIHDLGPDFMPFYERYLTLIVDLVTFCSHGQSNKSTALALEWCFNSLAFAFKYLFRILSEDLQPTFIALVPVFLSGKTYTARFCAEAFSFLLRKPTSESLRDVSALSLNQERLNDNANYKEALTILFSEAAKGTKGSLHSKAFQIISTLFDCVLDCKSMCAASVLVDATCDIMRHATTESSQVFTSKLITHASELLGKPFSYLVACHVLYAIWLTKSDAAGSSEEASSLFSKLMELDVTTLSNDERQFYVTSMTALFSTVVKRSEMRQITAVAKQLFRTSLAWEHGHVFLALIDSCATVCLEKLKSLGVALILQGHISKGATDLFLERLACTILRLKSKRIDLFASVAFPKSTEASLSTLDASSLLDVYWKSLLLSINTNKTASAFEALSNVFIELVGSEMSMFQADTCAIVLIAVMNYSSEYTVGPVLVDSALKLFKSCSKSTKVLKSFHMLLKSKDVEIEFNELFPLLVNNLASSNLALRAETIELLGAAEPQLIFPKIRIVDQVPLSVANTNDVKFRIRDLVDKSVALVSRWELIALQKYMIGLLSNQFRPSWMGVQEVLPKLAENGHFQAFWDHALEILRFDYDQQSHFYHSMDLELSSDLQDTHGFESLDKAVAQSLEELLSLSLFSSGDNHNALYNLVENEKDKEPAKSMVRSRIIEALTKTSESAESNGGDLVALALDVFGDKLGWSQKEKTDLLGLFATFTKLAKVPNSDKLWNILLELISLRYSNIQQAASDVILAWNIRSISKYRQHIKNLFNEKLFREQLLGLFDQTSDTKIEKEDMDAVLPVVMRILYGKAVGASKTQKTGRKFAIMSILPSLPESFIGQFLSIFSERIILKKDFSIPTDAELSQFTGFLNMLHEAYLSLGSNHAKALKLTVDPLIYCLVCSQKRLDSESTEGEEKAARTVRQLGYKCLNSLFRLLGDSYHWESDIVYNRIFGPRLNRFAEENAQQPSSLMLAMLSWVEYSNLLHFYYLDDFAPVTAIMGLLNNPHAKTSVIEPLLDFCSAVILKTGVADDRFYSMLALVVDGLLITLPRLLEGTDDRRVVSKCATLLLFLVQNNYLADQSIRLLFLEAASVAFSKPPTIISHLDKVNLLTSMKFILEGAECQFDDVRLTYLQCATALKIHKDTRIREALAELFKVFSYRFPAAENIGELIADLNSFNPTRMEEPDFARRVKAFEHISSADFTPTQWIPLLCCAMFAINDEEEAILRTNSTLAFKRFLETRNDDGMYDEIIEEQLVPFVKSGVRKSHEGVRAQYAMVLEYCAKSGHSLFEGLGALIDETSSFFADISSIQLHVKQAALERLVNTRHQVPSMCLFSYILPLVEVYAMDPMSKLAADVTSSLQFILRRLEWTHYKQLLNNILSSARRDLARVSKQKVQMIVAYASAFAGAVEAFQQGEPDHFEHMCTQEGIDEYVTKRVIPALKKILGARDDETIPVRLPLIGAAASFLKSTTEEVLIRELPGTISTTCQVLRSKEETVRTAVRHALNNVSLILGPRFIHFIIKELKSALYRGSQIHVLSYSIHSLLVFAASKMKHGDLDEAAASIVLIVMEDIFGSAGEEKDAEGYVRKSLEVKARSSPDTAELLASYVSLGLLNELIDPLKLLLTEQLSSNTKNKLDELISRYSAGIRKNERFNDRDILIFCHELHRTAISLPNPNKKLKRNKKEEHFLVDLDRKKKVKYTDASVYTSTVQYMAFTFLNVVLHKHPALVTVANLDGFLPLVERSLESSTEELLVVSFSLAQILLPLNFGGERKNFFEATANQGMEIVERSASTTTKLCEMCLRYIAAVITEKPDVQLNESAVGYLLLRVLPDLELPGRLGLAFRFLKAIVQRNIALPEVYDVMEKVSSMMITHGSKEVRSQAKDVFVPFLLGYKQGTKKLDKTFKVLVSNLTYPAESGRQTVMEVMNLLLQNISDTLIEHLATSFFVGFANVTVNDSSTKCREMASSLMGILLSKVSQEKRVSLKSFITRWLKAENKALQRCGLVNYKVYLTAVGFEGSEIDELLFALVKEGLTKAKSEDSDGDWEDLYTCLNVFSGICAALETTAFAAKYEPCWRALADCLLFPHSWVRLAASRLVGIMLANLDSIGLSAYEVQTLAYRHLRQMTAPSLSTDLASQIVKNMSVILGRWEAGQTRFITDDKDKPDLATDYVVFRVHATMRRAARASDMAGNVVALIQLSAVIVQLLSAERLASVCEKLIGGLVAFAEPSRRFSDELSSLARQCLELMETKLGISEFSAHAARVKAAADMRRQARRTEELQRKIAAPEAAAGDKIERNARLMARKRTRHGEGSKRRRL